MKNLFSNALGLPSRFAVALESEEDVLNNSSGPQVVFTGPLSDVYTQALDQVMNKVSGDSQDNGDPTVPNEPAQETGINVGSNDGQAQPGEEIEPVETSNQPDLVTKVVLESQAQDAMLLQSLHQSLTPQAPQDEEYETLFGVDETKVSPENIIEVAEILKNTENPETVSVLIDSELAEDEEVSLEEEGADVVKVEGEDESTEEVIEQAEAVQDKDQAPINPLAVSLENLVLGMGGKVYHSFGEYLASRKK